MVRLSFDAGTAFVAAALLVPLAAHADTPTTHDVPANIDLASLRQTEDYRQSVFRAAQQVAVWKQNTCADADASIEDDIGIVQDPVFNKGTAQSGAWTEHVVVEGCGARRRLNVLLTVNEPGRIGATPLLPGTTRADPILEKDGIQYAFNAASIGSKACQPTYIYDTAFIGLTTDTPSVPGNPAWTERWTIAQCDQRITVTMRFTPDATGTTISALRDAAAPAK